MKRKQEFLIDLFTNFPIRFVYFHRSWMCAYIKNAEN